MVKHFMMFGNRHVKALTCLDKPVWGVVINEVLPKSRLICLTL